MDHVIISSIGFVYKDGEKSNKHQFYAELTAKALEKRILKV